MEATIGRRVIGSASDRERRKEGRQQHKQPLESSYDVDTTEHGRGLDLLTD